MGGVAVHRIRIAVLSVLVLLLGVVLGACSSSSSTGGSSTGTLMVTVSGLPLGVSGNVMVTGPGGYTTTLTATTTLPNLTLGSYTVTGNTTLLQDSVVDTDFTATGGGAVSVSAGATSNASVTYSALPGSGKLWVTDHGGAIDGVAATVPNPTVVVGLSNSNGPDGLALDANGNLWVGMAGNKTLVEFRASQLASSSTPTPHVTIGSDNTSLASPYSLAFDAQGDLWVGNLNGRIEMYTPSQLAASGNPSPSVAITGTYTEADGLAFDANGNLWFSEPDNSHVFELTPSQLAGSGTPTPNVTLNLSAIGLAFDASGNLWAADCLGNRLTMFTAAQIAAGGSPAPTVTISDDGSNTLNCPTALALDDSGDVWVSQSINTLLEYGSGDTATSGSPAPGVDLAGFTGFTNGSAEVVFDPPPSNLPLYH